jgi:hypothetical protein
MYMYLSDATVEAACTTLRKAINAAENSNHNGEVFVVAAAVAPKLVEALRRIAVASNAGQIDGLTEEAVNAISGADEALLLAEGRPA